LTANPGRSGSFIRTTADAGSSRERFVTPEVAWFRNQAARQDRPRARGSRKARTTELKLKTTGRQMVEALIDGKII
jgi:hypothetical protein